MILAAAVLLVFAATLGWLEWEHSRAVSAVDEALAVADAEIDRHPAPPAAKAA